MAHWISSALLIQCATLLSDERSVLRRCPSLTDVRTMNRLLDHLGCSSELNDTVLTLDPTAVGQGPLEAPYDLVKTMRAWS